MKGINVMPGAEHDMSFTQVPLESLKQQADTEGTLTLLDVLGVHRDTMAVPTPEDITVKTSSLDGEDVASI